MLEYLKATEPRADGPSTQIGYDWADPASTLSPDAVSNDNENENEVGASDEPDSDSYSLEDDKNQSYSFLGYLMDGSPEGSDDDVAYAGLEPGGDLETTSDSATSSSSPSSSSTTTNEWKTPRRQIRPPHYPSCIVRCQKRAMLLADYSPGALEEDEEAFAQVCLGYFDASTPLRGNFKALYERGPDGESPTELGFEWPNTGSPLLDSRALIENDEDDDDLCFASLPLPSTFESFCAIEDGEMSISERSPRREPDLFDAVLGPPGEGYSYAYSLNDIPDGVQKVWYSTRMYIGDEEYEDEPEWLVNSFDNDGRSWWILGLYQTTEILPDSEDSDA